MCPELSQNLELQKLVQQELYMVPEHFVLSLIKVNQQVQVDLLLED